MKAKWVIVALLLPMFFLTGCASIVGRDVFPVTINSNPDGANIAIKDENGVKVYSGVTPTTVTLTAGESYFHAKSYNITFSKPGYKDQYVEVRATLSGWYFGNILFGGLIGMLIVDPITGKMWKLRNNVFGELSPEKTALNQGQRTLKIVTLDQIPKDMRKDLVSLN
jgi:hypothetical protein